MTAILAAMSLVSAGCGGGGASSATTATDDETAVTDTIRSWLTEGGCERMTSGFLEDQTFISDPDKACDAFEAQFSPPSYSSDDVVVSNISVGNDKATATVGDNFSNVTSTYHLVYADGAWKIDSVDL